MAFLVVSFLMRNIVLLRMLNMMGGILSCVYGFLTKTYPTAILNIVLVTINIIALIIFFAKKHKVIKEVKDKNSRPNET